MQATSSDLNELAAAVVARLNANVYAWYADRITFDQFTTRQVATWAECERSGGEMLKDRVLAILRKQHQS